MRKLAVAIASCAILTPAAVLALGLGDIHLGSGLNQPLNANIDLVSLRGILADDIKVSLANNNEFDKAGIERSYALNDLKFSVEGEGESAVVRVRTKDAIREPFLSFILEVNWPSGRLLREYTVLLDPPVFADEPAIAVAPQPKSAQTMISGTVSSPLSLPTMAGADSYGPTTSTDTLWSIASRVRPEGASVHQTLAAIFKANPQAFANNDPNQMLQGQTLKVPSAAEIAAMPKRKALAEIAGGTSAVVETRSARAAASSSASTGRVVLAAPPENFKTTPAKAGGAANAQAREAAEVLNQENTQLRGEVDKLAQKTQQLEKLLLLKEQQLAAIQGKAGTASVAAPAAAPVSSAPVASPSATTVAPVTEAVTDSAVSETSGSEVSTIAEAENAGTEAAPEAVAETARMPEQAEAPAEAEISWLMANLSWLLAAIAGVVILIGLMIRHRNKVAEEEFHNTLLPRDSHAIHEDNQSVELADDFDLPEVGDDILASSDNNDYSEHTEASVDPLGEADVYIAYSKFEQAETLLLQAIQAQPERKELRLKLLECYAEMRDSDKFRAMIAQMGDSLSRDNQMAQAVTNLQARAWPQDDLIGSDLPTADDIFGAQNNQSAERNMGSGIESQPVADVNVAAGEPSTASNWRPTRKADVVTAESDEFNLDANADFGGFGGGEDAAPHTSAAEYGAARAQEETSEFAFAEHHDDLPVATPVWGGASTSADDFALDDGEMALPSGDELGMSDIDEIATKLDLARAYIEMHEVDGAREILQEVLAEGNGQQKQEAQALLARI